MVFLQFCQTKIVDKFVNAFKDLFKCFLRRDVRSDEFVKASIVQVYEFSFLFFSKSGKPAEQNFLQTFKTCITIIPSVIERNHLFQHEVKCFQEFPRTQDAQNTLRECDHKVLTFTLEIILTECNVVFKANNLFQKIEHKLGDHFVFGAEKVEFMALCGFSQSWKHCTEFINFDFVCDWNEVRVKIFQYDWNNFFLEWIYHNLVSDVFNFIVNRRDDFNKMIV